MRSIFITLTLIILVLLQSCNKKDDIMIHRELFGRLDDGREVYFFTIRYANGMEMKMTNYGATIISLKTPDRNGNYKDIVLGYDSLQGYINGDAYFGAIVGRYGNRIAKGKFTLEGQEYQLTINNGPNHLHGGTIGYNKVLWEATQEPGKPAVTFSYVSPDKEQGYPGTLTISVTYTFTNNELRIDYKASTDKTTILNPTHHSYFNLTGDMNNTILDHEIEIRADKYTPVDSTLITTGEIAEVSNTPFDFRKSHPIGENIEADNEQLRLGKGYDHNWVLNNYNGDVRVIAVVHEPKSGRVMEVLSDQPGVQFYCGNFLNGTAIGKNEVAYQFRTGFCLEAQHYPDSPNKPEFPSVILKSGETYGQTTIYRFSSK